MAFKAQDVLDVARMYFPSVSLETFPDVFKLMAGTVAKFLYSDSEVSMKLSQ